MWDTTEELSVKLSVKPECQRVPVKLHTAFEDPQRVGSHHTQQLSPLISRNGDKALRQSVTRNHIQTSQLNPLLAHKKDFAYSFSFI